MENRYITLYNYKTPFMEFKDGFGYEGTLLYDSLDEKVQCHLCGKWFDALGQHVNKSHGMNSAKYKELVGLKKTTSLLSEKSREKYITSRKNSALFQQNIIKMREARQGNVKKEGNKITREFQNKRGTCPLQILDRIKKKADELGRTPTALELESVVSKKTVKYVYGSMENAITLAGLTPRKKGEGITYKTYTKDELITLLQNFKREHGRLPTTSDTKRALIPSWNTFKTHFGSFTNALQHV